MKIKEMNLKYKILFFLLGCFSYAQIGVGVNTDELEKYSLLSFKENGKGLVLPWVDNLPTKNNKGTFVFDTNDLKVKYFDGTSWVAYTTEGKADLSLQNTYKENGGGVVITDMEFKHQSAAKGVLVLVSDSRALILPKTEKPYDVIENPEAGTLYYDSVHKMICIFNGESWQFLK